MIRFIDLFAGIGGFHYGLDQASGQKYLNRTQTLRSVGDSSDDPDRSKRRQSDTQDRFVCVYSNEWDKYANSVYRKHFGECDSRDIRTVGADEIPDHDLLCAGFPCQSFSIAGKRGGFDDTRGTLFFDIARILRAKQPRLCLLENVKGLLSHDEGRTFATIIATLDELGYDLQWQVCNSKNFGVPQNRERVLIVGHIRGSARPQVFPIVGSSQKTRDSIESTAIDANYWKGADRHAQRTMIVDMKASGSDTRRGTVKEGYSGSLDTQAYQAVNGIRRLTPVECERLQGFPDNWTLQGVDGFMSDTQRYKMCGNAVTTTVIQYVGERL